MIELLVVISIIALLVALLLPSLKNARQIAQRAACGANQKSIAVALSQYAAEGKDYVPAPSYSSSLYMGNSRNDWHIVLGSSGLLGPPVPYLGLNHNNGKDLMIKGWLVFRCPGEAGDNRAQRSQGQPYFRWQNGRTSYAMNQTMVPIKTGGGSAWGALRARWSWGPDMNTSKLAGARTYAPPSGPADALVVLDMPAIANIWTASWFSHAIDEEFDTTDFADSMYAFRHARTANGMYMDGHVKVHPHYSQSGELVYTFTHRGTHQPETSLVIAAEWPEFNWSAAP